jgi:hypothetical protein
MHHWNLFLDPCPPNWHKEVSYVFRCPSVSLEHLEMTLGGVGIQFLFVDLITYSPSEIGYEPVNIGQLSYSQHASPFASPYPHPTLPSENWPRAQGNLTIYLRPVAPKKVPDTQIDAFLSSIDLPPPSSAIEGVSRVESVSNANDPSSDRKVTISEYQNKQIQDLVPSCCLRNRTGELASPFRQARAYFPHLKASEGQRRTQGRDLIFGGAFRSP